MTKERDGFVLALLVVMTTLLGAGLLGASRVFGYAMVAFFTLLAVRGFVNRASRVTWVPPVAIALLLSIAFTGIFAYESTPVQDAGDTAFGFQPGTAFLIYAIWLPAFFTLAVSFTLLFDRLPRTGAAGDPV